MRNILFATVAVFGLALASTAMADDFTGDNHGTDQQGVSVYMDQQATNAQLSDPTAPNSIRSHGHP